MIKKIKIASIYVNEEKEITSKKDGKKYKLCEVNVKVADDYPEYAGKYLRGSIFESINLTDPSKSKTARQKADYFKSQNEGNEVLLDVTESESIGKTDGKVYQNLNFKVLTKAQREVAAQFVK